MYPDYAVLSLSHIHFYLILLPHKPVCLRHRYCLVFQFYNFDALLLQLRCLQQTAKLFLYQPCAFRVFVNNEFTWWSLSLFLLLCCLAKLLLFLHFNFLLSIYYLDIQICSHTISSGSSITPSLFFQLLHLLLPASHKNIIKITI